MKCRFCKRNFPLNELACDAKHTNKSGTVWKGYTCRECNRNRHKKYRQTPLGKVAIRRVRLKYYKLHPERSRAWRKARLAQEEGILIPKPCEVCGEVKVHKHHPDPFKPLDVIYLCPLHHKHAHLV